MRHDPRAAALELSEIATSSGALPERAEALLGSLRRLIPFEAAWMALAEPRQHVYSSLAHADLDEPAVDYLSGSKVAQEIELTGINRNRPPLSPSDLPFPAADLPTWAECLMPAGIHEALAVGLFATGDRHVGFLALLYEGTEPPPQERRLLLKRLTPVLARAIDPMRSLVAAASLVRGATAGVVVRKDCNTEPLPGMASHPLLAASSPVLTVARAALGTGRLFASFLWPVGGRHAPGGHVRVTSLARTADVPAALTGVVLMSPPGDLRGLTPRELEVLGLLIDGCSNGEIAKTLVVAPRTVAAHLEHILAKLSAGTRTLAAIRAERHGLYVPRPPDVPPCCP
jgi:DNA-binding CsgD family transcriptional regulator